MFVSVSVPLKNIVLPPPPPLPPHRTKYSSLYVWRIYWFLMSSIFCPYWIPWVNVDIVRWCCNWILLNIFRAQTINQIQSAITPSIKTFHPTTGSASNHTLLTNENRQKFPKRISWNISSTEAHIKSYSSHKWKQTNFSKTKYLEIFLQLRRRNR